MKIVVTGTRGIPSIMGGVETHCEELFPRIAALGHDVTVIRRTPYVTPENNIKEYKGVHLHDVYAPRQKSIEAIIHTFLAIISAKRMNADVVHIHATGPSIMIPFARLLGMKAVMTHHGPDYERDKWGRLAKMVIKTGERMGVVFSNKVIVISKTISALVERKYGRKDTCLIYNGVTRSEPSASTDFLEKLGVEPGKYVFSAGRFVPEKNFHQLIDAFTASGLSARGYQLVIAGDSDHKDRYSESLKKQAKEAGVILPGFIKGERLTQLFDNAALFVLPSSHEGLPITLLEAMSHGLDVLVSDIPANKLNQLSADDIFKVGNLSALTEGLVRKISERHLSRSYDLTDNDWDNIARQTVAVYESILKK